MFGFPNIEIAEFCDIYFLNIQRLGKLLEPKSHFQMPEKSRQES